MYRDLRRDSICKGGQDQARGCPVASTVRCTGCGVVWECDDTGPADKRLSLYTGHCESCGSSSVRLDRCEGCPVVVLDACRSSSNAGRLLDRVLEVEFDLKHGLAHMDLVTCEERDALRALEQERARWEHEEHKRMREEAEQSRIMQNATNRPNR